MLRKKNNILLTKGLTRLSRAARRLLPLSRRRQQKENQNSSSMKIKYANQSNNINKNILV